MARTESRRLLTNALLNLSTFLNQLLIGIILIPFIVRHLGESTYGVWALVSSVLAYSQLLTLSLNSGVNRWIPMLLVRQDYGGINRVVSTVLAAFTLSTGVLVVAVAGLVWGFPIWFNIPPGMEADSRIAILVVGIGFGAIVQLSVFSGVLSGLERYDYFAGVELARGVVQVLGVILVLWLDGGIVELAVVYSLANIVKSVLGARLAFKAFPELAPRIALASRETFWEMLRYSVNTFLYTIQGVFERQMNLVLIGVFLTTSAVTQYSMPAILVFVMIALIAQLTRVLKPAVSRLDAADETRRVRSVYVASSKFALMIALPIGAVLVLYGDRILQLWLGDAYMPGQPAILAVLACATVFRAWLRPAFFVVVGMGRHRVFGRVALGQVVIATAVAFAGLNWLGWGTLGVAWASAIPEITAACLILVPYSARTVGLSMGQLFRESILPALLSVTPFCVAIVALEGRLRGFEGYALVPALGVVALLLPIAAWIFGFTRAEKNILLRTAGLRR